MRYGTKPRRRRNREAECVARAVHSRPHPPIQFQTTGEANAPPPVFFTGAGTAVSLNSSPPLPEKYRGRAERQGPDRTRGPRRLATSRLVESIKPQVRQVSGVPRAVFIGLLRSVPGSRPFILTTLGLRGILPLRALALERRPLIRAPPLPSGALGARLARQDDAAWTAGRETQRRISDAPLRPPLPAPASGDADQTPPRQQGRDSLIIVLLGLLSSPGINSTARSRSSPSRSPVPPPEPRSEAAHAARASARADNAAGAAPD